MAEHDDLLHELLHGDQFAEHQPGVLGDPRRSERQYSFEPLQVTQRHVRAGYEDVPDIHIGEERTRIGNRMYPSRVERYRPMVQEGMPDAQTPSHAVIPTESGWMAHIDEYGSAVLPVYEEEGHHNFWNGPVQEWVHGHGQPPRIGPALDLNEEGLHAAIAKIGEMPRPPHTGPPRSWRK